ncbi:MAG: shikimate dehydrogenase, partial [Betaproteobacteria bacterium]|nr:shikimate dehydrogenase [Betaproteobacteria bacterium]
HSKSPLIHRMFAEQTGQDISYEAILAPLDGFAATVERLRKEGYKGCNVTVPFKFEAFEIATNLSQRVQAAKAVNTLWFKDNKIHGDNTDGVGLIRDIERNFGVSLQGKRVLLMGTGGAAWGVAVPLLLANVTSVTIGYRNESKAQQLLEGVSLTSMSLQLSLKNRQLISRSYMNLIDQPISPEQQFDVVINATSTGLSDEMPPLPPGIFAPGALAYDMMYGRETPFMKFAREHGAAVVADGLGMLAEQAAESFFLWRGVRPDARPVIEQLRKQQ